MGLLNAIKEFFSDEVPGEEDYFKIAKDFEDKGMNLEAIREYEKLIFDIYTGKEYTKYTHITKKLVELYLKMGNYEKVAELWPKQYHTEEYDLKKKLELALILEKGGKNNLAMAIYDSNTRLQYQKIEFLLRQKKVDEANSECTRLLLSMHSTDPGIINIWMMKGKILMGVRRWEEAESYFTKILERQNGHLDAKKLRAFCGDQLRKRSY
jgi:tetratricopeptide (TPR) repeat protein